MVTRASFALMEWESLFDATVFWLAAAILMGGATFYSSLLVILGFGQGASNGNQQDDTLGLIIPLLLPTFGFAIVAFGRWLARNELSFLNQFVCDTLKAHAERRKSRNHRPSTRHAYSTVPSTRMSASHAGRSACCSTAVTR